mgnify:CR=1 FL=1
MIQAPTNCPSCDSTLVWVNDTLYCKNSLCPAQSAKRVEHFSKTLKIKGLGPASIEKLMIEDIHEIYTMDVGFATAMLGSVKLAIKLLEEIERSKQEPLNTVLPAFGISLVGKTATEKRSTVCDSIFDIDEQTCKQAGLGPAATKNLMDWLDTEFESYCDLPFSFEFEKSVNVSQDKGIVCISGKLKSFKTKSEATKVLTDLGYVVKDSLTKDVTILVNESGVESAKTVKAANSGVRIVNNINELMENK